MDIWLTTYLLYVDNGGHLTDHLPTSSCPRSLWTTPYSSNFHNILTLEEPPMITGITHRKILFGILIRTKSFLYNYNLPERSDEIFQKTIPYNYDWWLYDIKLAQHFAWIQNEEYFLIKTNERKNQNKERKNIFKTKIAQLPFTFWRISHDSYLGNL